MSLSMFYSIISNISSILLSTSLSVEYMLLNKQSKRYITDISERLKAKNVNFKGTIFQALLKLDSEDYENAL
jgi:hypothetical protein